MTRNSRLIISDSTLTHRIKIKVRFSEVDSMRVVWHGEYVKYFEDGREAFGREFGGLNYDTIESDGYYIPIVKLELDYKIPLKCGDTAIVETKFINSRAAKILFEYVIYRESDMAVAATGRSMQVFTHADTGELELNTPQFFMDWKKRWNIK